MFDGNKTERLSDGATSIKILRTSSQKPKILEQVKEEMRAVRYSPKTIDAYTGWIKRFILFNNKRHPSEMGEVEIREFINNLTIKEKVSASTQNQALQSILYLYKNVLKININKKFGMIFGNCTRDIVPKQLFLCSIINSYTYSQREKVTVMQQQKYFYTTGFV